ncbi:hypothetical protein B0T19DRAFT_415116 [Cercophora scortea]|uniref:Secreted protein n=1 Tax=Cercophora scortea TaxID=314031 RepID=A0AAE0IVW2_9PEZI|nr:hypothetical protein B0T19DRAFT_415116 [Cercophora scortea]
MTRLEDLAGFFSIRMVWSGLVAWLSSHGLVQGSSSLWQCYCVDFWDFPFRGRDLHCRYHRRFMFPLSLSFFFVF